MPRYARPPLTLAEVWSDGPPVRLRDLVAITGLHTDTIYQDIQAGTLIASKRSARTSPYFVDRMVARRWLAQMGMCAVRIPASVGTSLDFRQDIYRTHPELVQAIAQLMGLGSILRSAVSIANDVTGGDDGVQMTLTHRAWTGVDGYSKPTFASAITRYAVVDRKQRLIKSTDGRELLSRARLTFLVPITANGADGRVEPIDPRDKITLADGTTGPILDVTGTIDPSVDAPFALEVFLG